jgi:hypothetical protein
VPEPQEAPEEPEKDPGTASSKSQISKSLDDILLEFILKKGHDSR